MFRSRTETALAFIGTVAFLLMVQFLMAPHARADQPVSPPGQGECAHGNSLESCRPDPQPSHGADCDEHGPKEGGVNEDHCTGVTPSEPPTASPTPSASVEPSAAPSSTPEGSTGSSPLPTSEPSTQPTPAPTNEPSAEPSDEPSPTSSVEPSESPQPSSKSPSPTTSPLRSPSVSSPTGPPTDTESKTAPSQPSHSILLIPILAGLIAAISSSLRAGRPRR